MADERKSLMPDVGMTVTAYYFGNRYPATITRHGRKYPTLAFYLKSGRRVEGFATVIGHDEPLPDKHRGLLARMFHPSAYER